MSVSVVETGTEDSIPTRSPRMSSSRRTSLPAPSSGLVEACAELDSIATSLQVSFPRARARLRSMTPTPTSKTSSE